MTLQTDKPIYIPNVQHGKIYMDSMYCWTRKNVACKYYKLHTEWSLADVSILSSRCRHLQNQIDKLLHN